MHDATGYFCVVLCLLDPACAYSNCTSESAHTQNLPLNDGLRVNEISQLPVNKGRHSSINLLVSVSSLMTRFGDQCTTSFCNPYKRRKASDWEAATSAHAVVETTCTNSAYASRNGAYLGTLTNLPVPYVLQKPLEH